MTTLSLFDIPLTVNAVLETHHYLGPTSRGESYQDDYGVMVFANPASRRLPQQRWLELTRWCITSKVENAGSRQWRAATSWLREKFPHVTTVVSYSDPSAGHTGALYRACSWLWAPTWHRLRTPPTGNGQWTNGGRVEAAKDRWIFALAPDGERKLLLSLNDASLLRRFPYAEFRERIGGDYKRWIAERVA